jgi:hypothetical protein
MKTRNERLRHRRPLPLEFLEDRNLLSQLIAGPPADVRLDQVTVPLMKMVPIEKAPMAKTDPMVVQGQVRGSFPNGQPVATSAVVQGGLLIVQGQVRGSSPNGQPVATDVIHQVGFKPGTLAHIVITGWSFQFKFGDHLILNMGMWLQSWTPRGNWAYVQEVPVQPDGTITARYITFTGSQNQDNPFDVLINYAIFGVPR